MVFAAIAAGGIGRRMDNGNLPKQFMDIDGKPILIHTLEKFVGNKNIDKIIVLCPEEWIEYTNNLTEKYFGKDIIYVVKGGDTRADTIDNAINFICNNFEVNADDIIMTHDAVRPFINDRIIEQNIITAKECGACGTAIPATDTIFESDDGITIKSIPDRSMMYQQQTPQTFNLSLLKSVCESLSDDEKSSLTDACKIFTIKGKAVRFIKGELTNIKITYPQDIEFANIFLKGEKL